MSEIKSITLPHGAITWISNHTGRSRDYITEYIQNPAEFKGSPDAANKILKGIEAYYKHEAKIKEDNEKRLNAILSSTKE